MNPYQTAQTRINQLVGIKPTTVKNTFKNTDMKVLKIKELQKVLKDLPKALENKLVTTNEYCDTYYQVSQQIKKLTESR